MRTWMCCNFIGKFAQRILEQIIELFFAEIRHTQHLPDIIAGYLSSFTSVVAIAMDTALQTNMCAHANESEGAGLVRAIRLHPWHALAERCHQYQYRHKEEQ
jgi:hypothetical protein